jgi:hypothetical protein
VTEVAALRTRLTLAEAELARLRGVVERLCAELGIAP